jgi:hypothetical protein
MWRVSVRDLPYVAWAVILLCIGLLDVLTSFEPLGTLLAGLLTGVVYFYRHIIKTYIRFIEVRRKFILVSLSMVAINVIVGFSLNGAVDRKASDLVSRIESYRQKHGVFPRSILETADESERYSLTKNRIFLGAHYTYSSDGKTFYFDYDRYPVGDWTWNQAEQRFKPALD